MFVRDAVGPSRAPTLILLHGWTATADLNFFTCYAALSTRWRVIAFDQTSGVQDYYQPPAIPGVRYVATHGSQ